MRDNPLVEVCIGKIFNPLVEVCIGMVDSQLVNVYIGRAVDTKLMYVLVLQMLYN